jgi:hypothetical protein
VVLWVATPCSLVDGTLVLHGLSLLHRVCNKQKIPSLTHFSPDDGGSVSSEALDSPTRIQQGAVTRDNVAGELWE